MTWIQNRSAARALSGALFAFAAAGCSTGPNPHGEVGSAEAAITNVPTDGTAACISITTTGTWSNTQSFDVSPGQSSVFSLNGIPTGTVRFDASAYPVACALVTPMSAVTWVAAPVFAPVVAGQSTAVTLDLYPVGSAGVGVNFNPDPNCRANGAPCLSGAECCSNACSANGTCQAPVGCTLPSDCPGTNTQCRTITCNAGACGFSLSALGTPVSGQTAGDCQSLVCDGAGNIISVPDATDTPVTGQIAGDCLALGCDGAGNVVTVPDPTDVPVTGQVAGDCLALGCDGAGNIVTVPDPTDVPVTGQIAGDCQSLACDAAGNIISVPDPTDLPPSDGKQCTQEACQGGTPVIIFAATGLACNQNGGTRCDAAGNCVQCVFNTDCAPGFTCMGGTCAAPACNDLVKNGTETDIDCGGTCGPCGLGQHCAVDADCTAAAYCGAGICQAKQPLGAPATSNNACASGFAVDGFCCNTACTGLCTACSAARKGSGVDGQCGPVAAGTDPDNECASQPASTCGTSGVCDGAGACALHAAGTSCGVNSSCDGLGTCVVSPVVAATSPTEGALSPASSTSIAVTFSLGMSPATVTVQSAAGPCTGSLQVSLDGFASCIAFPGGVSWSGGNTVATISAAPGLLVNRSYKIRVTTAAQSAGGAALASAFTSAFGFTTSAPQGCSVPVVISQTYGGGGNASATYRNDFVELHNRDSVAVNLAGMALQYGSGTTWGVVPLTGTIAPGGYFLVQLASGGANGALLPTADLVGTLNMGSGSGKVALTSNTTLLTGACPATPALLDLVGYGATNCSEGTLIASLSATLSATRRGSGCFDTNNNAADFTTGVPAPRNSAAAPVFCGCAGPVAQNESNGGGEADYCAVVNPLSISVQTGTPAPTIRGRVFESGATGLGTANANIVAQIGYGPLTENPEYGPSFTWVNATYNTSCVGCGNQDEYLASFLAPAVGTYAYVMRVSLDSGQTWTYCDLAQADTGAGSSPGLTFDLENRGVMSVTP